MRTESPGCPRTRGDGREAESCLSKRKGPVQGANRSFNAVWPGMGEARRKFLVEGSILELRTVSRECRSGEGCWFPKEQNEARHCCRKNHGTGQTLDTAGKALGGFLGRDRMPV
jgi:hypothetical protein